MITLEDIRYVRIGTSDMSAAVTFATRILGLEVATQERHATYLRSDARDHTLVYLDAPADDHTVGFELGSADELEKAAAQLEAVPQELVTVTAE